MSTEPVSSLTVLGSVTSASSFVMVDTGGAQAQMPLVQAYIVSGQTVDDTLTFSGNATTITSSAWLGNVAFTPDSSLTEAGTITLPGGTSNAKAFIINNTSSYALTVGGTGTSVVINAGVKALVKYTGVSVGCYIVASTAGVSLTEGANITISGSNTISVNQSGFPIALPLYSGTGTLSASQEILVIGPPADETWTFPANLTNSVFESIHGSASANTTWTVSSTGTSIGTIVWPSGSNSGTASVSSSFTLAGSSSQYLSIGGPSSPDSNHAGVRGTIRGTR